MKREGSIEVRHPYVNEVPEELMHGFEIFRIDPEWQWVLVVDDKVVAQMLCVDLHGMLGIVRLTAVSGAPSFWLVRFLRGVLTEAKSLGLSGYLSFLSDQNPQERKLMRIVQRSGGILLPSSGVWACGGLEVGY